MNNAMQQMSQDVGLPLGGQPKAPKPKNKRAGRGRGGKPSGSPVQQHFALLQKAHSAGNFAQARTHALNYANASVKAPAPVNPMTQPAMGADDMGGSTFIQGAIKQPGALHRQLGIPQGQTIPTPKINAAANSANPLLAKRAQLAKTLKGLRK